jgi:predicted phosphate transport protein (TIGR00153 family)
MFRFIPHREKFFDLFKEAAQNALGGAKALQEMFDHYRNPQESWKGIVDFEQEGDRITHQIMRMLNQTFITPIDREDIYALTTALDDVIDAIEAVASRMVLYKIEEVAPEAKKLCGVIVTSTEQMVKVVSHMPKLEDVEEYCIEINRLENAADAIYREAVAALFEGERPPLDVIKWKEIYEILETTTDRCEDVANIVESIALKNA